MLLFFLVLLFGLIMLAWMKWNTTYSTMPYRTYLKTDKWKETSKAAKVRAGNRCQVCGSTERLETHHNTYVRRGYEADGDLLVLCHDCHSLFSHFGKLKR